MRKKIIYISLLFVTLFTACNQSQTFTVEGKISNAKDKKIFIIHRGLTKNTLLDSTLIGADEQFRFELKRPQFPDFYILQIEQQQIVLAVDSTETISISATYPYLLKTTFKNSQQSETIQKYRNTTVLLGKLLQKAHSEKTKNRKKAVIDSLMTILEQHKKNVKNNILSSTQLLSSYYALFQEIDNNTLFSLYDKKDFPFFRALATVFDSYMPQYKRSKNLHNLVLGVIKEEREAEKKAKLIKEKLSNKTGFIDIKLKDKNGYYQELSRFLGKPIVLHFTMYGAENIQTTIFDLQDFYKKYKHKGITIYQVGLDANRLFWEQAVSNKPWISVHDAKGYYTQLYNVKQVPTYFLLDKEGNIKARYNSLKNLKEDLNQLF